MLCTKYYLSILCTLVLIGFLESCSQNDIEQSPVGQTEILPWYEGKKLAVSITYDDGTVNQFQKAIPIMNRLEMKGTFFINTGEIPNSDFPPKFIGREIGEILEESSAHPTDENNLFERASAVRMLDMEGAVEMHNQAGSLYEQGNLEDAYAQIDEAYAKARNLKSIRLKEPKVLDGPRTSWDEIRQFAEQGHEFGVHTISHPRLAVMDEENLLYELLKCKEDIEKNLGPDHTFSAECPFGTEDERVMEYALREFEALRNRMPEDYLHEVNRWGNFDAAYEEKPYTQWQRGPLSDISLTQKKAWVDQALTAVNNPWLVLVYHGIDGVGWEAQSSDSLQAYFEYIHELNEDIWVGTFKEVTQYMKERMAATLSVEEEGEKIRIQVNHDLGDRFDHPLTLKTRVPENWKGAIIDQDGKKMEIDVVKDPEGNYFVHYNALPNKEILLTKR